jgi:hypothetical protein
MHLKARFCQLLILGAAGSAFALAAGAEAPASAPSMEVPGPDAAATSEPEPRLEAAEAAKVAAAIAALHAPEWATRQAAQEELMGEPPAARPLVEQALIRDPDPETRGRLKSIALHLYLKARTPLTGQASVLGITLPPLPTEQDPDAPGSIEVISVLPGFDAAEKLKPGDLILAINGEPLPPGASAATLRDMINPHPAQQPLKIEIKRGGKIRTVEVQPAGVAAPGLEALEDFTVRRQALAQDYLMELGTLEAQHGTVIGGGGATAPPPLRVRRAEGNYRIAQPRLPGQ